MALGLIGCATNYVPPVSGPTATITTHVGGTKVSVFQNAKECTDLRGYTFLLWDVYKPLVVRANQMNTFSVYYSSDIYGCNSVEFSFTPKVNNKYEVTYEPQGGTGFKAPKCVFKLTNLTTQKDEKVIARNYQVPFFAGQPKCEDKISGSV
jgi:hypothetical protein